MTFTATTTDIFLVLRNINPGGNGNDLGIDDISFGIATDLGDAPDSYLTTLGNSGACHITVQGLKIGSLIDSELNGIPATAGSNAIGDDLDNTDDEDGVVFNTLCTGNSSYSVTVNITNTVIPSARLIGWVDFNRNGTFEASEGTTVAASNSGSYTLTWTGLSGLVAGTTYARIRLTSDGSISTNTPGGSAADGEVEDYQIVINPGGGTITASATSLTTCSGSPVSISYTTAPTGQQTQWTRMPGNLSGLGDIIDYPTATGTTPVNYTYTASISNAFGCPSNVVTTVVTVNPVPVITPSVCSQTICSGETGAITFVSSVSATINWLRVEDGATGTGNISTLFNTAGTNTYKIWGVSAAPASCPSSTTITCVIVVNQCTTPCNLTLTASASSTAVCTGQAINLASSVSGNAGAVIYAWTGPNGFTSNAANPTVPSATSATAGTYFLTVNDPTSGTTCSRTASVNITVGSLYVAASSNSPVCTTGTLSLSSLSAGGSGSYTYAWTGPNGFVSAVQNPTLALSTTAQSGSYTVVITDAGGCSGTATTYVAVGVQPNLTISGAPGLTVCSGATSTLNVTGDSGSTVTWTNSIGQSGTGTAINFTGIRNLSSQPQSVTFVVTAMSAACTDQEIVVVTVNPEPVLRVTPNAAVYCNLEQITVSATALPNTATINWTRTPNTPNPPVSSGSGTGSVTVQQTLPVGAYTYQFTAVGTNGCSSQTASVPVTVQQ
ncbi:GEVED domain-containing protein [Larkinella sp. GY13]|uniref:GEVED domain-containing protein n=1 Tax=Larkinella sp. GY13 TaxID=3453720 RepID=UPI003EE852AA